MIRVKISGVAASFPEGPKEVSLRQYIKYCDLQDSAPQVFRDYYFPEEDEGRAEAITAFHDPANQLVIFGHYKKILQLFAPQLDDALFSKAQPQQLAGLVVRCMQAVLPTPKEEQAVGRIIEHEGEEWQIPKRFMAGSTVAEYLEAAQFLQSAKQVTSGQWQKMPYVMAILVRRPNEPYSEDLIKPRAKMFLDWPLAHAYRVGFFLRRQSVKLRALTQRFIVAQEAAKLSKD